MKLVGGASAGTAENRRQWTTALTPRSSGRGTHPTAAERTLAARSVRRGGRNKEARKEMGERRRSKTGLASHPDVKLATMIAQGPPEKDRSTFGEKSTKELGQGWCVADLSSKLKQTCTSVFCVAKTCRPSSPSFAKVWESAGRTASSECMRTWSWKEENAAKPFDGVGLASLEWPFPGFTEDCQEQPTFSAGKPGKGCKRSVDIALLQQDHG